MLKKTSIEGKYAYVNTSSEQFAREKRGVMSIEPLYENMEYKKYKAMVDSPLLLDVYEKMVKIEKELYYLRMQISILIDAQQSDDGG